MQVWMTMPVMAPNMQASPAARPSDRARPTNKVMSGPGVIAMMKVATANCSRTENSGTNIETWHRYGVVMWRLSSTARSTAREERR
jgi:hypothetical protein